MWHDLWALLINTGCRFEKETLKKIETDRNLSRYGPQVDMPDEGHYTLAAQMGHVSFCGAYEHLVGRKPFITKGISYDTYMSRYNVHNNNRTQGRLAVGSEFVWQGVKVRVTSFKDSSAALVACAYHPTEDGYRGEIKKRFTITHKALTEAHKKAMEARHD